MSPRRRLVLWVVLVLLLQWWVAPGLAVREIRPDFVLLFVLYLALYWNPTGAMLLGFVLGLGQDTLSWGPFGLNALLLTLVAYVPHLFRARLFLSSAATQVMFVIAFSLGSDLIESFYYLAIGQQAAQGFTARATGHLLWNVLFYLVLLRRWPKWVPLTYSPYEA